MHDKTILIVDDDAAIRDILSTIFADRYAVLQAATYSEALYFPISSIDLTILDYILPDRDGFAVLQSLREVNPALPVIFMTGFGNEDLILRALRARAADYLKKPLDLAYLRWRVSELLANDTRTTCHVEEQDGASRLDTVAAHIEEHYTEDLTLDALSRLACMSKFTFCRAFKARFGECCISYINKVRMKNATELLKNSRRSITEVAYSVGYRSSGHFNRVFRSIYEMSPREYRQRTFENREERNESSSLQGSH